LAICPSSYSSGTPAAADWLEFNQQIPASGVLEEIGIAMSAGEQVVVSSNLVGLTIRVHGFEA